jgi:hypothetical protein
VNDSLAEREQEGPDAHALAVVQENRLGEAPAAHGHAVDTGQVAQAQAGGQVLQQGMVA